MVGRGVATEAFDEVDEVRFASALAHLRPDPKLDDEALRRDAVTLVTALGGQRDPWFSLQLVTQPSITVPERLCQHVLCQQPLRSP